MDETRYNNIRTHAAKKYKHAHTLHKRRKSHIHTQKIHIHPKDTTTEPDTEQSFYNNNKKKKTLHTRNETNKKGKYEIILKQKVKSYEKYTYNTHTIRIHNTYFSKQDTLKIKNTKISRST